MSPDRSDREYQHFFENGKPDRKIEFGQSSLLLLLFLITFTALFLSVFALIKSDRLENELETLRAAVGSLKTVVDDDLYSDIRKFEDEDTYTDENEFEERAEEVPSNDIDVFASDYDVNYDDGDDDRIPVDDNMKNDLSADHEDLTEYLKGGQYTKEAKETTRSARSKRSAILEHENAGKNKTVHRRHYKYVPSGGDGVHSPVPKYAQGYSSPAWSTQQNLVSSGLKHYEDLGKRITTPTPPVIVRNSRVMQYDETKPTSRRAIKKSFLKAGEQESEEQEKHVVIPDRGRRNRHRVRPHTHDSLEERHYRSRIRILPSIQFSGDTSHYVLGRHPNYKGDGHLRHPNRTYVDWKENDWVEILGMNQHFILENGLLTIKEPGLYFTYAQIFYSDRHDINGFVVYKNQQTPLLQCTTTTHSLDDITKSNTCYTAGVEYLSRGDQISLRDISFDRYSIFEPGKSFFGVVKLGDGRV